MRTRRPHAPPIPRECCRAVAAAAVALAVAGLLGGCAARRALVRFTDMDASFPAGTIIDTDTATPVSFRDLIDRLAGVSTVYIGERHTDPVHHAVQLRILQALHERDVSLCVGMEMFAHTYADVLEQWSSGDLEEQRFVELTHWYANWRYDFSLYRDILSWVRENRVPLTGINIPFHLPAKIATGGLESLRDDERSEIANEIFLANKDHRAYLRRQHQHHTVRGRENFEYFYQAQCAWEDSMAEAVARCSARCHVAVLIGNGHIIRHFGVPDRAAKRSGKPFLSVYLAPAGSTVERDYADFIWITPHG